MKYEEALRRGKMGHMDTDTGVLNACWDALGMLIDERNGREARKLAKWMGSAFDESKEVWALGDIKDAKL